MTRAHREDLLLALLVSALGALFWVAAYFGGVSW